MASLLVLEHHFWLTLIKIKDAPISSTGQFGPVLFWFAEYIFMVCCVLHRGTEVIPGHETLQAKALQLPIF